MSVAIETPQGYRADLSVLKAVDGSVVVRASAHWRGIRTPAIDLVRYDGENAVERATAYVTGLKRAFEGEGI